MIAAGDLMFRQGAYHHTMLVSDPKNFARPSLLLGKEASQDIEIIHAASITSGVYREVINIAASEAEDNSFTFYRPSDPRLRFGIEFAKIWSRYRSPTLKVTKADETRGPVTYYSWNQLSEQGADMSRYSGVQDWRHKNTCPPFEFDALYRAFKWASRQRTGFSAKRGTTCCAFITACFQASAVVHYAESNYKRIAKGLELLSGLRGEKMAKSERISNYVTQGSKAKKISYRALRQYSNAGGFADHLFAVDDYCRFITKEIKGREQGVADLFPSSLLVDAKYNYSANFERMVAAKGSGWVRVL